jgi:alpha-ribazole phosphatase
VADLVAVTCIRHGLTAANARGAYIGWSDVSLSEEGIDRFRKSRIEYPKADLVVSSDLGRCRETAVFIYPDTRLLADSGFREMHFGSWEGKTYEQLKSVTRYRNWIDDPEENRPPGGESYGKFSARVEESWLKTVRKFSCEPISKISIITHGGPLRRLLQRFGPGDADLSKFLPVKPGCGFTLSGTKDQFKEGRRCTSLRAVPSTANGDGSNNFI